VPCASTTQMPARCVAQAGAGSIEGVRTYVIGVSHDSDASVRDVQRVLRKLQPTTVCLELPDLHSSDDPTLMEYRRFVAGEGTFSVPRWYSLYRYGFRSAALERWLGERTDHFTEYRSALAAELGSDETAGLEMSVAVQEAAKLGAKVERIDAPVEISAARAWNHKDIVSNLWALGARWWRTVPKASCPAAWRVEPPAGWEQYRSGCDSLAKAYDLRLPAERNRLALDVGAGTGTGQGASNEDADRNQHSSRSTTEAAKQAFEGGDLRVWLYERDLILADNLYRVSAATAASGARDEPSVGGSTKANNTHRRNGRRRASGGLSGSKERVVVGIVGLAHVPGIVANWGHQVDCSKQIGGLLHPKSHLPWQKRAMLAVAMVSVTTTMLATSSWVKQYRDANAVRSDSNGEFVE
jgi:hypothetical protein